MNLLKKYCLFFSFWHPAVPTVIVDKDAGGSRAKSDLRRCYKLRLPALIWLESGRTWRVGEENGLYTMCYSVINYHLFLFIIIVHYSPIFLLFWGVDSNGQKFSLHFTRINSFPGESFPIFRIYPSIGSHFFRLCTFVSESDESHIPRPIHTSDFSAVKNARSDIFIFYEFHLHFISFGSDDPNCVADRVLTDAHVKVILLDRKHDSLIVCTSLYQGTCNRKQRGDISKKVDSTSPEHVVANDANSSTVAFIAPGRLRITT